MQFKGDGPPLVLQDSAVNGSELLTSVQSVSVLMIQAEVEMVDRYIGRLQHHRTEELALTDLDTNPFRW